MIITALRVVQPIGEFFLTAMPVTVLAGRVRNRPRSSGVERSEDVQRLFSETRIRAIADFSMDPQATFPTPIILAVDSDVIREAAGENLPNLDGTRPRACMFDVPDSGIIGDVLDGQHRVLGMERSPIQDSFGDLPVVLMFDLDIEDKAFVFSIINSKQTPVSGSLIYDLFDLSPTPSPQKTSHYIAQGLNSAPTSPFYQRLKMLGRREEHHGDQRVMLSQGTFASRLQELISKNPDEDARLLKANREPAPDSRAPLRKYFLKGDNAALLKIVWNFFAAAAETFPIEWNDNSGAYIIRKSVGYTGLIIVLRHILEDGFERRDLSKSFFLEKFAEMKARLEASGLALNADDFPSNGSMAIKLAKTLLGGDLKFKVTEAPELDEVRLEE